MDKVRYFRDLLTTDECKVQIIIGPNVRSLLDMAIADYKDVPINQVCLIQQWASAFIMKGSTLTKQPILIFVRLIEDVFIEALQEEYPDCDLIRFEPDPTQIM
jgi:hypothetical protein